jgi:3-hydroxyisobutyrate dehydrogenase-like beta-hydroxyacid dehydrogenase
MSASSSPQIGLIGVGNAGQALAQALSQTHALHLFDRDAAQCAKAQTRCTKAPTIAPSAADLAARVDLLILSLPHPAASLAVAQQIAPAIRPGTLVVETSTVRPEDVESLHEVLAPSGAAVLDAAIIGGVHDLAAARGCFLVGRPEGEAGAAGAVLRSIAAEIFFLKRRGDGMRAKLVANGVAHTAYVLLLEAGALAAVQDIPLDVFYRLMERESGLMRPLTHRFGERLRKGDFAGGMSTVNACKDSGLILDMARELGVPLFAIAATHSVYEVAVAEGLGELDYAAMGRLWETWLGIAFADKAGA